jgi:ArsR family transcriptional regulator, arsenate/arsenite/antimonite-responsive transcriptional repressor
MQSDEAVSALAALGQSTRLATFRLLVEAGPGGLRASEIADKLAVPRNTMSAHLKILTAAGLIQSQRASREIIYRSDLSRLAILTSFLVEGCCGGRDDLCKPEIDRIRAF